MLYCCYSAVRDVTILQQHIIYILYARYLIPQSNLMSRTTLLFKIYVVVLYYVGVLL